MTVAPALILVPLFAVADRFIGGGLGWERLSKDRGGPLRGGPLPYAAPVVVAGCWAAGGPAVALFGLAWLFYRRGTGWRAFGVSAMTPVGAAGLIWALLRHAYPLIIAAGLAAFGVLDTLATDRLLVATAAFSLFATGLALAYAGNRISNGAMEAARGAAFGGLTALALAA